MEFYYIRHAQSTNNALLSQYGSEIGRSEDPELTELGQRQADMLADFIARNGLNPGVQEYSGVENEFKLTHLYTSLMVRAVQTGTAIARKTGVRLEGLADLHECGGIYLDDELTGEHCGRPGKNRVFFEKEYPELVLPETLGEQGWWNRPFEADEDRLPRAKRLLADILEKHGDTNDRVAVISHAGFYNEFLTGLMNLENRNGVWFTLYNASVSRIDFRGGKAEIVYQNRNDFLPREMIT